MRRISRRLLRDERGGIAILVAIGAAALLGAGALAVDLGHYRLTQNRLQSAADAAALAAVAELDDPATAIATAIDFAGRNVPPSYGTIITAGDVTIGVYDAETMTFTPGAGPDVNAVRVVTARSPARENGVPRALALIYGRDAATISARAIAARQRWLQYEAPEVMNLAPNAGDFNEMYAYCFDMRGDGPPESRRSQMTLIANNDPSGIAVAQSGGRVSPVPQPIAWPRCKDGESLSFRMRNIRHVKTYPVLWDNPDARICIARCNSGNPDLRRIGRAEHNYYTDTIITGGVETHAGLAEPILERIRCDSPGCQTELADGTIPQNRTDPAPIEDNRPCTPGRYIYLGWEDRPPGRSGAHSHWTDPAWTDRDYDDIRIVLRCPSTGMLGDGLTRLVR
jgi:hypothetical protein